MSEITPTRAAILREFDRVQLEHHAEAKQLLEKVTSLRVEKERYRLERDHYREALRAAIRALKLFDTGRPCMCRDDGAICKFHADLKAAVDADCLCPCHRGGECEHYPTCCGIPRMESVAGQAALKGEPCPK